MILSTFMAAYDYINHRECVLILFETSKSYYYPGEQDG